MYAKLFKVCENWKLLYKFIIFNTNAYIVRPHHCRHTFSIFDCHHQSSLNGTRSCCRLVTGELIVMTVTAPLTSLWSPLIVTCWKVSACRSCHLSSTPTSTHVRFTDVSTFYPSMKRTITQHSTEAATKRILTDSSRSIERSSSSASLELEWDFIVSSTVSNDNNTSKKHKLYPRLLEIEQCGKLQGPMNNDDSSYQLLVLVVDDSFLQRKLSTHKLAGSFNGDVWKVLTAETGEMALKLCEDTIIDESSRNDLPTSSAAKPRIPDVIIIDQNMSGAGGRLYGHEVVASMRNMPAFNDVVIIGNFRQFSLHFIHFSTSKDAPDSQKKHRGNFLKLDVMLCGRSRYPRRMKPWNKSFKSDTKEWILTINWSEKM